MSDKSEHLRLKKERGRFTVDCNTAIFSLEEIAILEEWGHWFQALTSGELEPFTVLQEAFVAVARQARTPFSLHEIAWNKYLNRKRLEEDPNNRLDVRYGLDDDTFYNRDMVRQQRGIMRAVVLQAHKG